VAALSLTTGEHVADPFRRGADVVALLQGRAAQTDPRGRAKRGLLRLVTA
jgi:hypothetical protein